MSCPPPKLEGRFAEARVCSAYFCCLVFTISAHTAELEKVVNKYNTFAADLTAKLDQFDVTHAQREFLDKFERVSNFLISYRL